jgi:hypothetical protein
MMREMQAEGCSLRQIGAAMKKGSARRETATTVRNVRAQMAADKRPPTRRASHRPRCALEVVARRQ